MYDSVPFDPPYVIKISCQEGERWVEVQKDGTEVPCKAPMPLPLHSHSPKTSAAASAAPNARGPKGTVLNVPYAQKDEAKRLGAKWDAARKKWYVPQGVNAEPFSRWVTGD